MGSKGLPSKIQAWQYTTAKGGLEKNLKLNSVAIPTPKPDQHLVWILATALNPVDYKPAELGLFSRLAIAKPATPGIDFVGRMVTPAAGSNLKPGELVFGFGTTSPFAGGCLKEYHAVPTIGTLAVPKGVEPLDAATIGVCGLTAYQSIIPHIKAGSRVFINGGSGGTGVFGIQIAKAAGCHVTTCCSTANVELCKSLGADEVIDYKKWSVLEALKKQKPFDHVVDNVGHDYNLYWKAHEYSTSSAIFLEVAGALTLSSFMFVLKAKLLPGFLGGGKRPFVTIFAECKTDQLQQVGDWMAEERSELSLMRRSRSRKHLRRSRSRRPVEPRARSW